MPTEGQKTMTIPIPRANRVSDDPWPAIAKHVAAVHHRKLNANVR